jgi:hypothetical protein
MSLKQGFVIGVGALAGGALGFYIQGKLMEKYRIKTEEFINDEVERRIQRPTGKSSASTRTEPSNSS